MRTRMTYNSHQSGATESDWAKLGAILRPHSARAFAHLCISSQRHVPWKRGTSVCLQWACRAESPSSPCPVSPRQALPAAKTKSYSEIGRTNFTIQKNNQGLEKGLDPEWLSICVTGSRCSTDCCASISRRRPRILSNPFPQHGGPQSMASDIKGGPLFAHPADTQQESGGRRMKGLFRQ